jgi:hypothetical protein
MKDDLGGLPSRTVLSEGSLTPFAFPIVPLCRERRRAGGFRFPQARRCTWKTFGTIVILAANPNVPVKKLAPLDFVIP